MFDLNSLFCNQIKNTQVPESLFQCQKNLDNLLGVPDYFNVNCYDLKLTISYHKPPYRNCVLYKKT